MSNKLNKLAIHAWLVFLGQLLVIGQARSDQFDLSAAEEEAFRQAAAAVAPAVVRIETLGGLESVGRMLVGTGPTTGLIVSSDGYIISSAFNFVQQPASILVTLPNGERMPATIVSRDHSRMLVLLKVDTAQPLFVPSAVPAEETRVGQWAIAVGKTFESDVSISVGIVSALHRIWGKAIQSDAKISPNNYGGPLVDVYGRVYGVLVPLSPQANSEVAGAEWYDSGIGFAIPLVDVFRSLDELKQGDDLYPGLMGISLKGNDDYGSAVEIAVCHPRSPAAEAGLRAGDQIVELNGQAIERLAQLKHVVGPLYAGDTVQVAVVRNGDRISVPLTLVDKLTPYEHPFLGILPTRVDDEGLAVRFVYPNSPADHAGIRAGDRIDQVDGQPAGSAKELRERLAGFEPQQQVRVQLRGESDSREVTVQLAGQPTEIPDVPLPQRPADPSADEAATGIVDLRIPEESGKCVAIVPDDYDSQIPYGLLVWLHPPGNFDQDALVAQWKEICASRQMIVLAPQSADPTRWLPTEAAFVRKTIDRIMADYHVDRARVALMGKQAGAAMAYLVAFDHRELIRGVIAMDSALPLRVQIPPNEPLQRLSVVAIVGPRSPLRERIEQGIQKLQAEKYPVTVKELEAPDRGLQEDDRIELLRWVDSLDRI